MTGRVVVLTGFVLGLVLSASQACVAPFECIYIYSPRPKLCAELFDVPSGDGSFIVDPDGRPPDGCACLTAAEITQLDLDYEDPSLDPLWAQVESAARANCEQFALDAGQDPAACSLAQINKASAITTSEKFDECKELVGTIDEDKDGVCPNPDETSGTGGDETSGDETNDSGGVPLPDLGLGAP